MMNFYYDPILGLNYTYHRIYCMDINKPEEGFYIDGILEITQEQI